MYTVAELMSRELITLREEDNLADAKFLLSKHHIRHLPVVKDRQLVGLVSHRDVLRCMGNNPGAKTILAKDAMTRVVQTVTPDTSARTAARAMLEGKLGCLPVMERGELVGIVTESDLVRFAVDVLETMDRAQLAAEYEADA